MSVAHTAYEPHAYLKKDYNEIITDPDELVSKYLEIVFPDDFGRSLHEFDFNGHFKLISGYRDATVLVLPDLPNGISTRASTMQFIQRNLQARDAVLFVHDPINKEARNNTAPQAFGCKKIFDRTPSYVEQSQFETTVWKQSIHMLSKMRLWDDCQCFRLGLKEPSPAEIAKYVKIVSESDFHPRRCFVVMDQRQMPGQEHAQYSVQDWREAFGSAGYSILIDLYAKTSRE